MTVTTQQRRQTQFAPQVHYPQPQPQPVAPQNQTRQATLMVLSSLKASVAGGAGLILLLLISRIPANDTLPFISLAYLAWAGYPVVCLASGLLASIMASDSIRNSQQGGKVGWMAGFWAGIYTAIMAMVMSAAGFFMVGPGQRIAEQLNGLVEYGITADTLSLAGRVFLALIWFGVIGSLVSAFISSIGGMIYPKLGGTE